MAVVSDSVGVRIDPRLLAYELAIRGRGWTDLTLNHATVARLKEGEPVKMRTQQRLAAWLAETPVVPALRELIERPVPSSIECPRCGAEFRPELEGAA